MEGDEDASSGPNGRDDRPNTRRVVAAVALAFVPWTVVFTGPHVDLFFPFGLVPVDSLGLTTVFDFYVRFTGGLPAYLNAWGLSVLLFAVGLVSALVGLVWREDARVTGAMFVLAGFGQLVFALGFLGRSGPYVAVPIGTVLLWGLVWRYYRSDLHSIVRFPDGTE